MASITLLPNATEGTFLNKWFRSRAIKNNKNVIIAFTGSTGSGKTYCSLRAGEDWYKFQFNSLFPIENVCFSLGSLIKRIVELRDTKKLKKGTLLILEEAGANYGSLDFQNKVSKMFSYILQSFRSMNILLLMTVPVLTMINKQARQLIHASFITAGINYESKEGKIKPFFHQLDQRTGKPYWHYPKVVLNKRWVRLQRINFKIPSKELLIAYERKKESFVFDLSEEFIVEFNKKERDKVIRESRKELTDIERKEMQLRQEGHSAKEIAKIMEISEQAVSQTKKRREKKGYIIPKREFKTNIDQIP